jgi:hypothetical protein
MPKQLYKIIQFHGGLNSNSDPRDIAESELSEAKDVMVDELGKIRLMGGITPHVSVTPEDDQSGGWTGTLVSGFGLFYFSHDRIGGHNRSIFTGTHTGGDSNTVLIDSAAAFTSIHATALVGATVYNLTDHSSGKVASVDSGTQITLDDLTGGTDNSWDTADDDEYVISLPETGDNYLVLYDDNDQQVWLYSRVYDKWGASGPNAGVIDIGTGGSAKPCFYTADGALRISDGSFNSLNTNKWYGYIERAMFKYSGTGTNGESIQSGWFVQDQEIKAPTAGHALTNAAPGAIDTLNIKYTYSPASSGGWYGGAATKNFETGYSLIYDGIQESPVIHMSGNATGGDPSLFITPTQDEVIITVSALNGAWNPRITGARIYISQTHPVGAEGWIFLAEVDLYRGIRTTFGTGTWANWTFNASSARPEITKVVCTANTSNDLAGVTGNPDGKYFYFDNSSSVLHSAGYMVTGGTASTGADTFGSSELDVELDNNDSAEIVAAKTAIVIDDDSDFIAWAVGDVVYIKTAGNGAVTASVDGNTGFVISQTQVGIASGGSGYATAVSDKMVTEPVGIPFQTITGFGDDITTTAAKYKTAVVVNRRAYIGNVEQTNNEGQIVVKGDAMLKSPVNQFDIFTEDSIVEASINDGDEIVKLEAYADRILQFKKEKMQLINISKELEFLEDTFMHKGVSHPAATCKTDFGIAWVNRQGCYLYDGQKITNLLEKQGRQIIKESDWEAFTTDNSMIGYLPKKRQLIVLDQMTSGNNGEIFLYDIVTQSWVHSSAATFPDDQNMTNFITDWNGDLVNVHTAGTVVKWADAAAASSGMVMSTKDIDFGHPGQKKTVYKVIVTFQSGGAATNVDVDYGVDGATNFPYDFTSTELPSASGWQTVELVPDVSSEASNIKSFVLRFAANASVPAAFEINDISIVYRLKGIR